MVFGNEARGIIPAGFFYFRVEKDRNIAGREAGEGFWVRIVINSKRLTQASELFRVI
jgi:hypothetical protein